MAESAAHFGATVSTTRPPVEVTTAIAAPRAPPASPAAGAPSSPTPQSWFLDQDPHFLPAWARSHVKYAQNLLECSDEPIEYDHDEVDYRDNCFFFPEDCVYRPRVADSEVARDWASNPDGTESDSDPESTVAEMSVPMLSNIKMLDISALSDLLEDNLSPPEITSIFMFAPNGAPFAYASSLPQRQVRGLCATYGAAYKAYAVSHASGNLTGVNPSNPPSSFVTTPSIPLGDVGSIIFEQEKRVGVVTKIADKVLLAVVGPVQVSTPAAAPSKGGLRSFLTGSGASETERTLRPVDSFPTAREQLSSTLNEQSGKLGSSAPGGSLSGNQLASRSADPTKATRDADKSLHAQWEIDRTNDLDRLAGLNLTASPTILLALESKSAALGKFLGNKLADLECPEDF